MPKGMMLAAGRGTRLGPLTDNLPKPLLPVANQSVLAQGIRCLQRLGISDIGVNISYLAERITEVFGDGRACGVNLHWRREPEPIGTAGGMKGLQHLLSDDTIIVISGDAVIDIDLEPLLASHRARGAFASLATTAVTDPAHYGVVVTDADGRVMRFQEKPAPGSEISRQANTGIYVFEPEIFDLIPEKEFCDFALNVFPEILKRGLPFFARPVEGYWTDIGNPGDYLQANMDYLAGRIRIEGQGLHVNGSLVAADAVVAGADLKSCVIGAGAILPPGSSLSNCVVWPGAIVREPISLNSAIITPAGVYQVEGKEVRPLRSETQTSPAG